jgi:hypothetical protein
MSNNSNTTTPEVSTLSQGARVDGQINVSDATTHTSAQADNPSRSPTLTKAEMRHYVGAAAFPMAPAKIGSIAELALAGKPSSLPLAPHIAAATSRPAPVLPTARIPAASTGRITLGVGEAIAPLPSHTFAAPLYATAHVQLDLLAAPPTVSPSAVETVYATLRSDLATPGMSLSEMAAAALKHNRPPAGQAPLAMRAVISALSGGSAVSWLAACSAAHADLCLQDVGAYPAATGDAATHWLANPATPATVQVVAEDNWPVLASIGSVGQLVLRASSLDDREAWLLAQLSTATAAVAGPRLRRTHWSHVTSILVIVPGGGRYTDAEIATRQAAWRTLLPAAAALTAPAILSAVHGYCARHALIDELRTAVALVCSYGAGVVGVSARAGAAGSALNIPRPYGSSALLGAMVMPTGTQPGSVQPSTPIPLRGAEWAGGIVVASVAIVGASIAITRDCGADPIDAASCAGALAYLSHAAAACGGDAEMLARATATAYAVDLPLRTNCGPGGWSHQMLGGAPANTPTDHAVEALCLQLFGSGAGADIEMRDAAVASDAASRIHVTRLPGVGAAVLVPYATSRPAIATNAAALQALGVAQGFVLPAPTRVMKHNDGSGSPVYLTDGALQSAFGHAAPPGANAPSLLAAPAADLGPTSACGIEPPPSCDAFVAEEGGMLCYAAPDPETANRFANVLKHLCTPPVARSIWTHFVAAAGNVGLAAPVPAARFKPRLRNYMASALEAMHQGIAPPTQHTMNVREAVVPTPHFSAPGPVPQPPPAGPGVPHVPARSTSLAALLPAATQHTAAPSVGVQVVAAAGTSGSN